MITQVLHSAVRFISQHTAPNIPHLPASTPSSLSPCSSPKPWPEPSDCTLGLIYVCVCTCACMYVCLCMRTRDHASWCPIGWWVFVPLLTHDGASFCRCMVRSCQFLTCLSVCTAILDVVVSWPVCIWNRVEQKRLRCVPRSGWACLFPEGQS